MTSALNGPLTNPAEHPRLATTRPPTYGATVFASWNDVGFSAGLCGTADGFDYWEHLEERHAEHRRHVRNLVVICAVICLAAIVVHPAVLGFGALVVPLLLIEVISARRSRTRLDAPRSNEPHRFVD